MAVYRLYRSMMVLKYKDTKKLRFLKCINIALSVIGLKRAQWDKNFGVSHKKIGQVVPE